MTSILVYVGLDLVGDGVMKLPFLSALRRLYPEARVTWLAGQGKTVYAGVLAPLLSGLVDEVIQEAGIGLSAWELISRPLGGRRFDLVIDTQRRVVTSLILKRIPHGKFISASAGWALSDAVPKSGKAKRPSMIGQMFALLEAASGAAVPAPPPVRLAPDLLTEAERRLPGGPRYVGLAPGAGGKHKCWPLGNYLDIAVRLAAEGLAPVFLIGPAERDWEVGIRAALPKAILPLTDSDGPPVTMALGTRLSAAIANDSGTGHMLAAAGVPLLSLFGPTPPAKFAPAAERLTVIRAQDFGGEDMAGIPVEPVMKALTALLAAHRS
ncbi:MAG TPA: glycosyltransferase family 9 protein [Magnetospirillaceae bacterium]|nr:glycosyltransferase family 9 protein [Magnetospirillaceae bacterium]